TRTKNWLAVAHFARQLTLRRDPSELLDVVSTGQARMIAGAAGDEIDPLDLLSQLVREAELGVDQVARLEIDPAAQGVLDGARLLEDLLEHEVLVAALFRLNGAPIDTTCATLDLCAIQRLDAYPASGELGHLAILQDEDVAGVAEQR